MKRLPKFMRVVAAVAIVLAAAAPALAVPVSYLATGVFSISGTNVGVFGAPPDAAVLTYTSGGGNIDTPASVSFGTITTAADPAGSGSDIGGQFTLTITQAAPSAGSEDLVGVLAGHVAVNSGVASLTFPVNSINIGGVIYSVNTFYNLAIPSSTSGSAGPGVTTIQGTVDFVQPPQVPEPTSILLLGTGLVGLAATVRRKLNRR